MTGNNAGASRSSHLTARQDKSEGTCRSPASPATIRQENSNAFVEQQSTLITRPSTLTEAVAQAMATGARSADDMYNYIQHTFTDSNIEEITSITTQQADSLHWMLYRRGMVTASIAYSVYTRVHTLRTKMGPHDVRPLLKSIMREHNVQTSAMSRGILLEKTAKEVYTAIGSHTSLIVKDTGLLISKEHPCIGASPDGLVTCDCCSQRTLEVKCPISLDKFRQKEIAVSKDENVCLKKTSKYFCQVQIQMMLAKVHKSDFFVFQDAEHFLLFSVDFDEVFCNSVVERAVYFFKSYVLPHIAQ